MTSTVHDGVLMWPIAYFWKTCGVFLTDLSYNRFQKWFSAAIIVSGIMNIVITPWSVCVVDSSCDDTLSTMYRQLYSRMMACSSLMSRVAIVYKVRKYLSEYKRREDAYERNWPLSGPYGCRYRAYASIVITVCLMLMVPMNLLRLYLLYGYEQNISFVLLLFFFNVYLQNWSMCCMETHFALLCFMAYLKFQSINDELSAVRADVMVSNRYPAALRSTKPAASNRRHGRWWCIRRDDRNDYELQAVGGTGKKLSVNEKLGNTATIAAPASVLQDPLGHPLEMAIEMLRIRHGMTRESVAQLNNIFGVQLTVSLIALCIMTLFDIYNEAFHQSPSILKSKFSYGWMLQYLFRFFVIIITAHNATQEVTKCFCSGVLSYVSRTGFFRGRHTVAFPRMKHDLGDTRF